MVFCIITHVEHTEHEGNYFAYAPYVNEMNLWGANVDKIVLLAPKSTFAISPIHTTYKNSSVSLKPIFTFDLVSLKGILKTFIAIPFNCWVIFWAMKNANHIHLRCPGNIGLLGCFVQIFFPNKTKTAKYAGNWAPKSKQPWTYRLQKLILSNTFLTRNMQVLVYGGWQNQSKNIVPFFTATYREDEKIESVPRPINGIIRSLFVGTLSVGKQPLYAIQCVQEMNAKGCKMHLDLFGEGPQRKRLEHYISENNLQEYVQLKGNQSREDLMHAYQTSHFLFLPSLSEGWPKAVAEAMFFGCVPLATSVSCVPQMLDFGKRGILLSEVIQNDSDKILTLLANEKKYQDMANDAKKWSRNYTIEHMEAEIKQLLS